jgi:hypothetical protein
VGTQRVNDLGVKGDGASPAVALRGAKRNAPWGGHKLTLDGQLADLKVQIVAVEAKQLAPPHTDAGPEPPQGKQTVALDLGKKAIELLGAPGSILCRLA